MKDWKKSIISPKASVLEALQIIDAAGLQIALVIDENEQLLGTVTDGDVRRGLLKGVTFTENVSEIMNRNPLVAMVGESKEAILQKMTQKKLHQIPVIDENGKVQGMEVIEDILTKPTKPNSVILIAGGLGTRLMPLTESVPKPMLKVGPKPILETILENFIEFGFRKFYFSVNYKSEQIQDYFRDGSKWGVEITYLHEQKRMGTAGALSLIKDVPKESFFVMNADLLTKINFEQLLAFHQEQMAAATMCVRQYDYQVPYGVVKIQGNKLKGIEEKPIYNFFINAGIYVLEPETIDLIPKDKYFDMPMLFEKLLENNKNTAAFPIREYWLDIGHKQDFDQANEEFNTIFG